MDALKRNERPDLDTVVKLYGYSPDCEWIFKLITRAWHQQQDQRPTKDVCFCLFILLELSTMPEIFFEFNLACVSVCAPCVCPFIRPSVQCFSLNLPNLFLYFMSLGV